ncbi:alcohol dehydrogenase [Humibacillus sp. DSM 29435]|uniref:zinc-dependent alcohol dehydrogenase family protein n=1 Tax=Humibacillus sp. DSM 29435 TaxID=1869167 RepID=UPI000871D3F9|nr:zinc-dependent alcohol dehydrogenase family protein [Humibacillus sp. DSM 29435]OFE17025.1 alcohol dehydrogenase [Humibacillus sp. DSM 29435]
MRAVVYDEYGQLPTVRSVAEPPCPAGSVIVRVRATGVCRSDWHAWSGHDPVRLPHVPGHEFAGVVDQVGAGVTRAAVGDRVTAPFACGCGVCEWCRSGDAQVCPDGYQPGFSGPGSFAELVMVPAANTNLVHLPDSLTFTAAAALGCRFATAFRALHTHGNLAAGQWLVVFGSGGVGLSVVMIGRAIGARVIAVDVSSSALDRARELGAEHAFDAGDLAGAVAGIREVTGGGAHVGIDAIGSPSVASASIESLRPRGRHVQVGLLLGADSSAALPMGLVIARELAVFGSHGMPAVDYPAMLELVANGRLDPAALVNRVVGLEQAGEALVAMGRPGPPGLTVVVLDPAG